MFLRFLFVDVFWASRRKRARVGSIDHRRPPGNPVVSIAEKLRCRY
jgi:hypothetical protein